MQLADIVINICYKPVKFEFTCMHCLVRLASKAHVTVPSGFWALRATLIVVRVSLVTPFLSSVMSERL